MKFTKWTRVHHAVSPRMVKNLNFLANTFMGFKDQNQKKLFFEMMDKLGPEFIRFSIKALLDWKNKERPSGDLLQIVGTKDVLFDHKKMKEPVLLDGEDILVALIALKKSRKLSIHILRQNLLAKCNEYTDFA
ncbi:MAG: hypothetical protein R2809_13575 [Flavobacteriales bacterium]